MKDRVFVDTDIVLDLLAERLPYVEYASRLFTLADHRLIDLFVSSLSFSNLHYLLSKQYSNALSLQRLRDFKILVRVAAVDDKIIELALNSSFPDFEHAIQYFSAQEIAASTLLTRNLRDYKNAEIPVMTAEDYVKSFHG